MMLTMIYLILPLLLTAFSAYATDVCYFPTGVRDVNSWACNKTAYANGDGTACCSAGDTCMGNGVCYQGWTGIMYRQSCTDRTWGSPNCASVATTGQSRVVFEHKVDQNVLMVHSRHIQYFGRDLVTAVRPKQQVVVCCRRPRLMLQ